MQTQLFRSFGPCASSFSVATVANWLRLGDPRRWPFAPSFVYQHWPYAPANEHFYYRYRRWSFCFDAFAQEAPQ